MHVYLNNALLLCVGNQRVFLQHPRIERLGNICTRMFCGRTAIQCTPHPLFGSIPFHFVPLSRPWSVVVPLIDACTYVWICFWLFLEQSSRSVARCFWVLSWCIDVDAGWLYIQREYIDATQGRCCWKVLVLLSPAQWLSQLSKLPERQRSCDDRMMRAARSTDEMTRAARSYYCCRSTQCSFFAQQRAGPCEYSASMWWLAVAWKARHS